MNESARALDREILRLAGPAFLALVAEPLFLLADAAIVGHLGTTPLAGLGIAATVLQTAVGLCVFLAYGTTAQVSRRVGAGDRRGALRQGVDGLWLAALVGLALTALGVAGTAPLTRAFGAGDDVTAAASTYLRIGFLGVVPLLLMLAATGVLRGLQDTRTPLVVAVAGNAVNVGLNLLLVRGIAGWSGLGIGGSALGSVIAQAASAAALVAVVAAGCRRERVALGCRLAGVRAVARAGAALVVRTLTLRAALVVTALAVAAGGTATQIAAHQLASTLWAFLAFALDAIAIAAQAVTGRLLGSGDAAATHAVTRRMLRWGIGAGTLTGLLLAALSPVLGALFTDDAAVRSLLVPVLLLASTGQPAAGVVYVLDGILIGAGDGRYLAKAGLVLLACYAPVVLLVSTHGLLAVWAAFVVVLTGGRLLAFLHRARGDAWLVTGAEHPSSASSRLRR